MRSSTGCARVCLGAICRNATGPYTTAYNRFNRWSRRGVWKRIFDALAAKSRDSLYLIDSTIVKAHRAASGAKGGEKNQAIGISRGGRTTKIHAVVDGKGRSISTRPKRKLVCRGAKCGRRVPLCGGSLRPAAGAGRRSRQSPGCTA